MVIAYKYYTKITQEEMIKARTDDIILMDIMTRLAPYINYVADIMYRNYGGRFDRALTRDDLYSFCSINIIQAIRRYYHPERYNKKKDINKKKHYTNGFNFICQVCKRMLKYFWRYHRRQKRIPPEVMTSLDAPINPNQDNSLTVRDVILNWDVEITRDSYIADAILAYFKKNNKKLGNFTLYSLVKHIVHDSYGYKELAKLYKISDKKMRKILKDEFIEKLKVIKL